MNSVAAAEAAPGRFCLGLGTSSPAIVEKWNGVQLKDPLRRMRETLAFLRQALAGEVGQLLNDDETWERLSQNAWKWASNHTWDQSASSFRTIIDATLAKAKEH